MGYINSNGVEIYYEVYGNEEPLVFIEGLAQQISMWKYQVKDLKNHSKLLHLI